MHTCAFRTLRILYCQERNRRVFKALLPVAMFELFVNIGNTELELRNPRSYRDLVAQFASLPVRPRVPLSRTELHSSIYEYIRTVVYLICLLNKS